MPVRRQRRSRRIGKCSKVRSPTPHATESTQHHCIGRRNMDVWKLFWFHGNSKVPVNGTSGSCFRSACKRRRYQLGKVDIARIRDGRTLSRIYNQEDVAMLWVIFSMCALNGAENSQLDLLGTWKQRPAFSVLLMKPEQIVKAEGRKWRFPTVARLTFIQTRRSLADGCGRARGAHGLGR
ncbi:hypothetical protein BJV77DRAFT_401438 [Russula vinacea]|nr:hypothetical protein BJV77DRAFT_401438 [Russula vinacea]